jgi:hypothetical protein
MAYTIIRSNGSVLTTIQDGTLDTTSTSLGLPGRNFSGYGQVLDSNFVKLTENFAASSPPANPVKGQLWFNTTTNTLNVCPADGTLVANSWLSLSSSGSSGLTNLASLNVTGDIIANNITANSAILGDTITVRLATVTDRLTSVNANITNATLGSTNTQIITTGSATTSGSLTGVWTVYGNSSGNALVMNTGNLSFPSNSVNGIKCDNYMYANGVQFNPAGTYNNIDVSNYLTGSNGISQFTGNIAPTQITTTKLAGGGTIAGLWTLESGARLQATYADLAERFEADDVYDTGTVVELGGDKEITSVKEDLSDRVFGVISSTAAYLMNSMAGKDDTHPAVAISGRVNVKVHGIVKKGDRLVSAGNGYARAAKANEINAFNVIGRSLVTKLSDGPGHVEAIVVIK